jgi:hypothetical protein
MMVFAGRLCDRWKYAGEELPLPPKPMLCCPGNDELDPVVNCRLLQMSMGDATAAIREPLEARVRAAIPRGIALESSMAAGKMV